MSRAVATKSTTATPRTRGAPARRRRITAEARRAQILDVARTLFGREGIDATSLRRIAAEAGVTAPLLYRHFADKDALLRAITDGYFARLEVRIREAWDTVDTPVARLEALMRAYVTCGFEHPNEYELTFMTALPRLQNPWKSVDLRVRRRRGEAVPPETLGQSLVVLGMLEQCVGDVLAGAGQRRTRVDDARVAALSEIIWASGHGLVSLVNTHQEFGFTDKWALLDLSIESMLHGIATQAARAATRTHPGPKGAGKR
jgi:AcrR family transcriptional regulator